MTIIVAGLEDWAAGSLHVGYNDLSNDATITASSAATDWPVDGLKTWLPKDRWKSADSTNQAITVDLGSQKTVNSIGLYKHNLGTIGATLTFQYSSDGSSWSDARSQLAPSDNSTIFRVFDSRDRRYWRVKIDGISDQAVIGVLFVGESMRWHSGVQDGFAPPGLDFNDDILNSQSQGGEFIGRRVIVLGGRTELVLRWAPPSWVRNTYRPFLDHARVKPFFLGWNVENYPQEVAYCWTDDRIEPVTYQNAVLMRHSMGIITR